MILKIIKTVSICLLLTLSTGCSSSLNEAVSTPSLTVVPTNTIFITPLPKSTTTPLPTPSNTPVNVESLEKINPTNVSSITKLRGFKIQTNYVLSLAWSEDSSKVYVLGREGTFEIWDVVKGKPIAIYDKLNQNGVSVGWNPTLNLVAYQDFDTNDLIVRDASSGNVLYNIGKLTRLVQNALSVDWSPDNSKIVSIGWDETLRVWNASTGEEIQTLTSNTSWFESADWSPDGQFIATGNNDGLVRIIRTADWKTLYSLQGHIGYHEGGVPIVTWSPDGSKVASGGRDDRSVFVWSAQGFKLEQLCCNPLWVFSVAWSPDNSMIASGGEGWEVTIWNANTGLELYRIEDHKPITFGIAWSPNGRFLATSNQQGEVIIWGVLLRE